MSSVSVSSSVGKPLKLQLIVMPARQKFILPSVQSTVSLSSLQSLIESTTGLSRSVQSLFHGFPPKELDLSLAENSLESFGLRSGDSIEIRKKSENPAPELQQGKGWDWPSEISRNGLFQRKDMPKDNSCLFHSIAYLCESRTTPNQASAHKIREIVANLVAADPHRYSTVFLGSPNHLYQDNVLNPNTWGGAIELSILSNHYQTEIIAFDFLHLREDIFGQSDEIDPMASGSESSIASLDGYKRRVFLLYSGDHYDALVYQVTSGPKSGDEVTVFSTKDQLAWARARDYIHTLHLEASRAGLCQYQKEWRHNKNLGKNPRLNAEAARLALVKKEEEKKTALAMEAKMAEDQIQAAIARSMETAKQPAAPAPQSQPLPQAKRQKPEPEREVIEIKDDPEWSCSVCTLLNPAESNTCSACGTRNPSASTASRSAPVSRPTAASSVPRSTGSPTLASTTALPPPSATEWSCPTCSFFNPVTRIRCSMCSERNPNAPSGVDDILNSSANESVAMDDVDSDGVRAPIPQTADTLIAPEPLFPGFMPPTTPVRPTLAQRRQAELQAQREEALKDAWDCERCSIHNPPYSVSCSMCQSPNPALDRLRPSNSSSSSSAPAHSAGSPSMIGAAGNFFNKFFGSSSPRWSCEQCGTDNAANLIRCKACKNPNIQLLAAQAQAGGPENCSIM